jgi:hypothetical protein
MSIELLTGAEFAKDFAFKFIAFFVGLAAGLATYAIIVEPLYQAFN